MPAAKTTKKITKKAPAKKQISDEMGSSVIASSVTGFSLKSLINPKQVRKNKLIYLGIAIIIVALIVSYKKGLLIAATVNGKPITTLEVLMREDQQYRAQVVENLVGEQLILQEAKKKGVTVTEKDVDAKLAEVEKQNGGASALDALLSQQGLTRAGIRPQIKINLLMEKMYSSEASVSAEEVNQFIEQNKEQMQSTDSAGQIKESTDYLKSQKLNQIFSQKFAELKKAANIKTF